MKIRLLKDIFIVHITCILFLASSCYKKELTTDQFYQKTYPLIISTLRVEASTIYLNTHSALIRPPATIVNILTFIAMDGAFKKIKYCLFYKMPHLSRKTLGRLFLTSSSPEIDCKDHKLKEYISEIENIQELSIHLNDQDTIVNRKRFQKNIFYIEFKKKDELRTLTYPLYNYQGKKENNYFRYSSSFKDTLMKGVMISAPSLQKNNPKNKKPRAATKELGLYESNYKDKNLTICHSFKSNCQEDISFKCDQCRFGWFQAISTITCGSKNTKFCGRDQCGGRGMPACIRGEEAAVRMGLESKLRCYENSPAGYCNAGLETSCDGSYLICL